MESDNIVGHWLSGQNLSRSYCQAFIDNGYDDLEVCKQVGERDLDAIGVIIAGDRRRILTAVQKLREHGGTTVYLTFEHLRNRAQVGPTRKLSDRRCPILGTSSLRDAARVGPKQKFRGRHVPPRPQTSSSDESVGDHLSRIRCDQNINTPSSAQVCSEKFTSHVSPESSWQKHHHSQHRSQQPDYKNLQPQPCCGGHLASSPQQRPCGGRLLNAVQRPCVHRHGVPPPLPLTPPPDDRCRELFQARLPHPLAGNRLSSCSFSTVKSNSDSHQGSLLRTKRKKHRSGLQRLFAFAKTGSKLTRSHGSGELKASEVSMSENELMQLMCLVKDGHISVDVALETVKQHESKRKLNVDNRNSLHDDTQIKMPACAEKSRMKSPLKLIQRSFKKFQKLHHTKEPEVTIDDVYAAPICCEKQRCSMSQPCVSPRSPRRFIPETAALPRRSLSDSGHSCGHHSCVQACGGQLWHEVVPAGHCCSDVRPCDRVCHGQNLHWSLVEPVSCACGHAGNGDLRRWSVSESINCPVRVDPVARQWSSARCPLCADRSSSSGHQMSVREALRFADIYEPRQKSRTNNDEEEEDYIRTLSASEVQLHRRSTNQLGADRSGSAFSLFDCSDTLTCVDELSESSCNSSLSCLYETAQGDDLSLSSGNTDRRLLLNDQSDNEDNVPDSRTLAVVASTPDDLGVALAVGNQTPVEVCDQHVGTCHCSDSLQTSLTQQPPDVYCGMPHPFVLSPCQTCSIFSHLCLLNITRELPLLTCPVLLPDWSLIVTDFPLSPSSQRAITYVDDSRDTSENSTDTTSVHTVESSTECDSVQTIDATVTPLDDSTGCRPDVCSLSCDASHMTGDCTPDRLASPQRDSGCFAGSEHNSFEQSPMKNISVQC